MGKGKPRTATHRKANKWLESMGSSCEWWDGGYPECNLPWCGKGDKECQGNPFVCKKLMYRYIAGCKKIPQAVRLQMEHYEKNNKQQLYGHE